MEKFLQFFFSLEGGGVSKLLFLARVTRKGEDFFLFIQRGSINNV